MAKAENLIWARSIYEETNKRFVQYFLNQASQWGTRTHGSEATNYISIVQDAYPNIRSALSSALSSLRNGTMDNDFWNLWRVAIGNLFTFYDYRGLWEESYVLLSEGLQVARERNDAAAEALFLFHQAIIEDHQGQIETALEKAERSLQLFELVGDERGIANLLHFRGTLLQRNNRQAAHEAFERVLRLWEKLEDKAGRAGTLYEIGRLEEVKGNAAEAEKLYREALTMFTELNAPREQATLLFQLGELLVDTQYLERALQIYKDLMDERGYAQALHQLGRAWQKKGDSDRARSLYYQALQIFRRLAAARSVQSVERDLNSLSHEQ